MASFLENFRLRKVLLFRPVVGSVGCFSLVFDKSGHVWRLAIHIPENRIGSHVVFVGHLSFSSGSVYNQLLVLKQLLEDALRRKDTLS